MRKRADCLTFLSYHEAGHAVVGASLGLHVYRIAVDRGSRATYVQFGRSEHFWKGLETAMRERWRYVRGERADQPPVPKVTPKQRTLLRDYIRVNWAGYLAEVYILRLLKLNRPKSIPIFWSQEDYTLQARGIAWVLGIPPKQRRDFIAGIKPKAEEDVASLWPVIDAVARKLTKRHVLSGKSFTAVMRRALKEDTRYSTQ
jgi:hypothetical protein